MITRKVTIPSRTNISSQNVYLFEKIARRFKSSLSLKYLSYKVNAKSVLGLMAIKLVGGVEVEITANGEDEKEAISALCEFLENGCSAEAAERILK